MFGLPGLVGLVLRNDRVLVEAAKIVDIRDNEGLLGDVVGDHVATVLETILKETG